MRRVYHHAMNRRRFLHTTGLLTGGALIARVAPVLGAERLFLQQAATPSAAEGRAAVTARRQVMGATPITQTRLGEKIVLFAGPGGNVIVQYGPDGKVLADGFVDLAWPNLKKALDALDPAPLKTLIDTHWHFDHVDNNLNAHNAGATIVAHENTRTRLSQTHDVLGMHFDPAPAGALPTQLFKDTHTLHVNGEDIHLEHAVPAHTDTDIFIHYARANVLHMGDVFFNGIYPFIDASTGGNINGVITACDRALKRVDAQTKVVPGHGPLGDKAALIAYRDMLATVRDAVKKMKTAGKSLTDAQAAKPTAAFDEKWGKGMMTPDAFVANVYNTL
jgi:cyclase